MACIIIVGCLSGSLRDLLSLANVIIKPESWSDLFTSKHYADKIVVLITFMPSFKSMNDTFTAEIAARQARNELILVDIADTACSWNS